METERALDNVDRLITGNMPWGQDARNEAQEQDKTETEAGAAHADIVVQTDFPSE